MRSAGRAGRLARLALAAAALLAAPPARADEAGEAKAMFDHGIAEMAKDNFDVACPAFAESYRKNPLPGALFTLADCEAKRGRIATAVKRYEEYLAVYAKLPKDKLLKQRGRDVHCKEQISLLLPQIPKVTLLLADPRRDGLVATLDGVPLERAALDGPIPIDPGEHVVFVQVTGEAPVEQRFSIAKSETKTLPIELRKKPDGDAAGAGSSPGSALRIAGIAAGAAGVVGIVIGAVTGGLALGKKGVIQKNCTFDDANGVASCNATGRDAGRSAGTLGAVSTGTFIAGALAAGAGATLLVLGLRQTGKDTTSARVRVLSAGPDHAMLGVEGAW